MIWKNLSINKCPQCSRYLNWGTGVGIHCPHCDFKISAERYKQICASFVIEEIINDEKVVVLCDQCKAEFIGPAYLMNNLDTAICPDCQVDSGEETEDNYWG